MNDARARWTRYTARMTRDKLAARRRQAERFREAGRALEQQGDLLLGVPLAWRRWQDEESPGSR